MEMRGNQGDGVLGSWGVGETGSREMTRWREEGFGQSEKAGEERGRQGSTGGGREEGGRS